MEILNVSPQSAVVRLSTEELLTLNNALNEVTNGLDLEEFQTRMGVELSEARSLLDAINALIRRIRASETLPSQP